MKIIRPQNPGTEPTYEPVTLSLPNILRDTEENERRNVEEYDRRVAQEKMSEWPFYLSKAFSYLFKPVVIGIAVALGAVFLVVKMAAWFWGMTTETHKIYLAIYLAGAVLYLIYSLVQLAINFLISFSTYANNMRRIGLHFDVIEATYGDAPDTSEYVFKGLGIIGDVLLSWVSVAIVTPRLLKQLLRMVFDGRPKEIKEIGWKLRNFHFQPADVLRFNIRIREVLLGRQLNINELCDTQEHLAEQGIELNVCDVLGEALSEEQKTAINTHALVREHLYGF